MVAEKLPAPLVPADCDLRGMEWLPLYGGRLFGSDFDAHASDAEFRAGVQLWWAAWNQVPAASVPDDDVALSRLAGLGREVKAWRRVKERALHGFVKCTDGRLYHRALAEFARESWARRLRDRERKTKWREEQERKRRDRTRTETGTERGQDRGQNEEPWCDGTADETRRDETRQDATRRDSNSREGESDAEQAPTQIPREFSDKARKMGEGWAKPLPEGWGPSDDDRAHVAELRPDLSAEAIRLETAKFVADVRSKAKTSHDWGQSWRRWVIGTFTTSSSATETYDQRRMREAKEAIR